MGYFPLPELKGKPNRIFVDGKTLNQIAKESGIRRIPYSIDIAEV